MQAETINYFYIFTQTFCEAAVVYVDSQHTWTGTELFRKEEWAKIQNFNV